jgi:hypothetical protein
MTSRDPILAARLRKRDQRHGGMGANRLEAVEEERPSGREAEWESAGEFGRRAMQCGENLSRLLGYFNCSAPCEVTWSHATNSWARLEKALSPETPVMFLEADVSWGCSGPLKEVPIMAHPPSRTSDLTFEAFIKRVVQHNAQRGARRVGIKLDFKDARCIEPCLSRLRAWAGDRESVGFPVWVNADVWSGPGAHPPRISPAEFFGACFEIYPAATLSPGWTVWLRFESAGDAAARLLDPSVLQVLP